MAVNRSWTIWCCVSFSEDGGREGSLSRVKARQAGPALAADGEESDMSLKSQGARRHCSTTHQPGPGPMYRSLGQTGGKKRHIRCTCHYRGNEVSAPARRSPRGSPRRGTKCVRAGAGRCGQGGPGVGGAQCWGEHWGAWEVGRAGGREGTVGPMGTRQAMGGRRRQGGTGRVRYREGRRDHKGPVQDRGGSLIRHTRPRRSRPAS